MKFLHTSDWHLGASDGTYSLLEDQACFIEQICAIAVREGVDAVIVSGDVYDRSVASADAMRLYDKAVTKLCGEYHIPVILIAGNHDGAERLSNCAGLLSSAGLYVYGVPDETFAPVSFQDTDVYCLPWINEETVRSLFPEEKDRIDSTEAAYRVVLERMRETFDPTKKHVIAAHAFVTSAETSESDRAAAIGFASRISASVFDGFDYAALGHLHKPQSVTGTVRYSGTPMPYSFGKEETQEKSVTLVDTSDMSVRTVPLELLHKRTTLKGTLAELMNGNVPEDVRNGYVRLVVTDDYVGQLVLSNLRGVYPNLLECEGKSFEGENTTVTLTIEELEGFDHDPVGLFRWFCKEELKTEPDERLVGLFEDAVRKAEEQNQ